MFGKDVSTPVSSPEKIEVREDTEKLSDKKGDIFHSFFVIKRSIPYLDSAVGFLMTKS